MSKFEALNEVKGKQVLHKMTKNVRGKFGFPILNRTVFMQKFPFFVIISKFEATHKCPFNEVKGKQVLHKMTKMFVESSVFRF